MLNKTKNSPKPLAPRCEKFKSVNTDTDEKVATKTTKPVVKNLIVFSKFCTCSLKTSHTEMPKLGILALLKRPHIALL